MLILKPGMTGGMFIGFFPFGRGKPVDDWMGNEGEVGCLEFRPANFGYGKSGSTSIPGLTSILNFQIHDQYRGKKLGYQMMSEAIEMTHAFGIKKLWLEVMSDNVPAQKIYIRHGFKFVPYKTVSRPKLLQMIRESI